MAIKSSEYLAIMKACHWKLHLLRGSIDPEVFYHNLDELRKQFKIITNEFNYFTIYPRANNEKLYEAVEIMEEYCSQTDVEVKWTIPKQVVLDESNWAQWHKVELFANFYFRGTEITELIHLGV